jgi:hypothetical protein
LNLHGIVSGAIGAINPQQPCIVMQSTGYTTADDGTQIPKYKNINGSVQIQALSGKDIVRLAGLNIQGVTDKGYITGNFEGVFRKSSKGGDLLKVGGDTYLISVVLERWPDWVCVALTMQIDD